MTDVEPLLVLVTWRPLPYLLLLARVILEPGDLDVSSVNADEECRRVCIPRSRNVVDGAKRGEIQKNLERERERGMQGLRKKIATFFSGAYAIP